MGGPLPGERQRTGECTQRSAPHTPTTGRDTRAPELRWWLSLIFGCLLLLLALNGGILRSFRGAGRHGSAAQLPGGGSCTVGNDGLRGVCRRCDRNNPRHPAVYHAVAMQEARFGVERAQQATTERCERYSLCCTVSNGCPFLSGLRGRINAHMLVMLRLLACCSMLGFAKACQNLRMLDGTLGCCRIRHLRHLISHPPLPAERNEMPVLSQAFVGLPMAPFGRSTPRKRVSRCQQSRVWAFAVSRLELDDMPGTGKR